MFMALVRWRACVGLVWAAAAALLLCLPVCAQTVTQTSAFSFVHNGSVSTGLVSLGGTFTNSVATSPTATTFPRFDPTLGTLTGAAVTVTTTTSTFAIASTGLLSLASSGTATRTFAYAVSSGTATGSGSNAVTSTGSALLTLLSSVAFEIGGAPLASTTTFSAAADLAALTGSGTVSVSLTGTDFISVTAGISALNGAGLAGSGTYAGSIKVVYTYTPFTLAGYVYNDVDRNGFMGAGEAGTGLALYAKLVPDATPAGPALQAVAVNATTGFYTMGVSSGIYRIVIDDNATLSDVTPAVVPSGWTALQQSSLLMTGVDVWTNVFNQNFGLVHATAITGRLFRDDGAGSGTANDGIANGAEASLAGLSIRLIDSSNAVLDSATSRNDGSYRLFVPSTVANGAVLRVQETNLPSQLSTGASIGSSGGVYSRTTDAITLSYAAGAGLSGLDFGDVPSPTLAADAAQSAVPGSTVFYGHRFTASSNGQVVFTASHVSSPAIAGWSELVYLDANQNGRLDAGEAPVSGAISVVTGQSVFLVVKTFIPEAAPLGARTQGTLRADMSFSNAAPALTQSLVVYEVTDVMTATSANLVLTKAVDKASAVPGSVLVYSLSFTNGGSTNIANVVVFDATPAYTKFVSATLTGVPSSLGTPVAVLPTAGSAGTLRWTFPGVLPPSATGTLQFTVSIDP
jgi:uncharacterized repeat protein (TIGR01451 family)